MNAPKKWVEITQAADFLSIPKKTLYSLAARGRLPEGSILRLGRALRFNLEAIEAGLAGPKGRRA